MKERGHETLEHTADMGIRGWGASLEEALEETAASMFELMADIHGLEPGVEVTVTCSGKDEGELLVEFLNALICAADVKELILCSAVIDSLKKNRDGWSLEAIGRGVPRDEMTGRLLVEVKAATYCGISVTEDGEGSWVAQCVVDL
jgi:SHS2 domain-containing protein